MKEILSNQPPLAVPFQPPAQAGGAHSLLLLIQDGEVDLAQVAHRAWEFASPGGLQVRLLGMSSDPAREAGLMRDLITLAAMLKGGGLVAHAEVLKGTDWAEAVKSHWHPGDVLACLAGQKPSSEVLRSKLDVPMVILPGSSPALEARLKKRSRAAAWGGLLATVLLFCLLQAGILLRVREGAQGWMLLSVVVEYGLIAIWNRRLG